MRSTTARPRSLTAALAAAVAAAMMLAIPAIASATPTTVTQPNTTYYVDKATSSVFYLTGYGGGCGGTISPFSVAVKPPAEPDNYNPDGPVDMLFRMQNCNTLKDLFGTLSVQGGSSAATINIPTGKLVLEVPNMCYGTNTEPISIPGTWTNGSVPSLQPSNFSAYGVTVPVKFTMCGNGYGTIKFEWMIFNFQSKSSPFDIPLVS